MAFDRAFFADKLKRYRDQFQLTDEELAERTGLGVSRIGTLCAGAADPTGDEVLILSDVFHCDYRFFISHERTAPFQETEELFRRHGSDLSRTDRWAIQEFLHLCECEAFLLGVLHRTAQSSFAFVPRGTFFKGHGQEAAAAFRRHLGLQAQSDITDVFSLLRSVGLRVFRRSLENSNISGLFVDHPTAGACVLVNYSEDVWRQRFTALHEACHALLDRGDHSILSFAKWNKADLKEIRADTFAAHVLLPDALMDKLPVGITWTAARVAEFAVRLKVNHEPLLFRLRDTDRISDAQVQDLKASARVPLEAKGDPELPATLTALQRIRRTDLLRRGLSPYYTSICFEAFEDGLISRGRLGEMLLTPDSELEDVALLLGRSAL